MARTHKTNNQQESPNENPSFLPLCPSIEIAKCSAVRVSVEAVVDGKSEIIRLAHVKPRSTMDDIRREFGGGKFEFVPIDKNQQEMRDGATSFTISGEPLWRQFVEETIAARTINTEEDEGENMPGANMGFPNGVHQQPAYPQNFPGYPNPPYPGYPQYGMPPGYPGMPQFPGMFPGMNPYFNQNPAAAVQPVTAKQEDGYHVHPGLPPEEAQRRYDKQFEQSREMSTTQMMLQFLMQQNQRPSTSAEDANRRIASLEGDLRALKEQNEFLTRELNRARQDLEDERRNARSEQRNLQVQIDQALDNSRNRDLWWQSQMQDRAHKMLQMQEELGMMRVRLKENVKGFDLEGTLTAVAPMVAPVMQGLFPQGMPPAQALPSGPSQPIPNTSPVPGTGGSIP